MIKVIYLHIPAIFGTDGITLLSAIEIYMALMMLGREKCIQPTDKYVKPIVSRFKSLLKICKYINNQVFTKFQLN
jgi:hypothetical protein